MRQVRDDETDDGFAFLSGVFMGFLIGALIAIFLAPTDGQTLRKKLKAQLGLADPEDELARPDDPLLTPRDVATEERVADQRLPAYSH